MQILDELQILEPLLDQMAAQENKEVYHQQLEEF